MSATIISTLPALHAFLSTINPSTTLYLDLEGTNLSRRGTISIITVLAHPQTTCHLIDIHTLGAAAFTSTPAESDNKPIPTLKAVLESPHIPKTLWDVRCDADALFALYQVRLANVFDLQLLEVLARPRNQSKRFVRGLGKCIDFDLRTMDAVQKGKWMATKKAGREAMERVREQTALIGEGLVQDVFAVRPMERVVVEYCVNDVVLLPGLGEAYMARLGWRRKGAVLARVQAESERRLEEAKSVGFVAGSRENAFSPWKDE